MLMQGEKWMDGTCSKEKVDFEKRITIKSHVLADFIAEWTEPG
jgi:hypothetical protein